MGQVFKIVAMASCASGVIILLVSQFVSTQSHKAPLAWALLALSGLYLLARFAFPLLGNTVAGLRRQTGRGHSNAGSRMKAQSGGRMQALTSFAGSVLARARPHALFIAGIILTGMGCLSLLGGKGTWREVHVSLVLILIGAVCMLQYGGKLKETLAYAKETKVWQSFGLLVSLDVMWLLYDGYIGFWQQSAGFLLAAMSALLFAMALLGILRPTLEHIGNQVQKMLSGAYGWEIQAACGLLACAMLATVLYAFGKLEAVEDMEFAGAGTELGALWIFSGIAVLIFLGVCTSLWQRVFSKKR